MKRAASPPRASTPRALYAAAPTFSRSPSAAPAAAVRRANAPRARQPPLLRLTASRPRARAAPTAPEPADRVDEIARPRCRAIDAERAVLSRADALVPFERGVGLRRTLREHSSHALRIRKPPPRRLPFFLCPVTPFASRTHMRTDESRPRRRSRRRRARGLAAAQFDAERAALSRADASCPSSAASVYAARRASTPRTLFALASRLHGACPSSCALWRPSRRAPTCEPTSRGRAADLAAVAHAASRPRRSVRHLRARRRHPPHARRALPAPATRLCGGCPRLRARDASRVSHSRASRRTAAAPLVLSPSRVRPPARADPLALRKPGIDSRRTPGERSSRPQVASVAAAIALAPVTPAAAP